MPYVGVDAVSVVLDETGGGFAVLPENGRDQIPLAGGGLVDDRPDFRGGRP
jgi:hypothetical protein